MLLLTHILIATTSIILSTITVIVPSKTKFYLSYFLIALTIATGTFLIFLMPAHMVQTCITGLTYLGIVSIELVFAHFRLAKHQVSN